MGCRASKSSRSESNDGNFIFNAGCLGHALSVSIGEAEYDLLRVLRNRDTAHFLRFIFAQRDRPREGNAIDEIIVSARAFRVVLNGVNLRILLKHFELELERVR
jgi:hypothetical protein